MQITKEGRHEYSKKRRKLVRKGLNPYDDQMLINLDKEWAQLRVRISAIKHTNYGTLTLMNEFENLYYLEKGIDTDLDKILYEVNILRGILTEPILIEELDDISKSLSATGSNLGDYLKLKRLIVKLQAKANIPIHFYEALDDEYKQVYEEVMTDNFKTRK